MSLLACVRYERKAGLTSNLLAIILSIVRHLQEFHEAEATRDHGIFVPLCVATEKVGLDLLHIACRRHAGYLVNVAAEVEQRWREHDHTSVCLERREKEIKPCKVNGKCTRFSSSSNSRDSAIC